MKSIPRLSTRPGDTHSSIGLAQATGQKVLRRVGGVPGWHLAPGLSRGGATLTEALVALGIMAIGVISLASLFPIAVLKTAKANQLTISTDIRYNAEAMIKVFPWIIADPNPADTGPFGVPDGIPFNDYDFSSGRPFLFDPHGCVGLFGPAVVPPERPVTLPAAVGFLPRYPGGFNGLAAADSICSGPDTWVLIHDSAVTGITTANTRMDVSDLANVQLIWPGPNQMRVQIFYNGGKSSLTRSVTGIVGSNTLVFSEDVNGNGSLDAGEDQNQNQVLDTHALPAGITYESARLEARERRYTWLLTVRPQDTGASFTGGLGAKPSFDVHVVVYFGRGFSLQEEQVYGTVPAGVPAISNGVAGSAVTLNEGNRLFTVTWPAGETPFLKRGGWILDAANGYWYQIENYTDPTNVTSSTITLSSTILETSTLVVFPRGVADVFPIKPQTL